MLMFRRELTLEEVRLIEYSMYPLILPNTASPGTAHSNMLRRTDKDNTRRKMLSSRSKNIITWDNLRRMEKE